MAGVPVDKARALAISRQTLSGLDARILEGVAGGLSTVQLSARVYLSRQGVDYHISALLRRFRVSNRAALASRAYSMGILSSGSWPPRVVPECVDPYES